MDSISNLPDDVIFHIVSFLSAEDAANIQVVSKNWVNQINVITKIEFAPVFKISESFRYFVDWLLAIHPSHRLRRFALKIPYGGGYNLVNDCLINVMNRGVLDLELVNKFKEEDYSLPVEFFTCKCVVKLKLWRGFVIDMVPENALLPGLKTLVLFAVRFDGGSVFQRLISACPVLEELVIDGYCRDHWTWCRSVSSQILKRLTIHRRRKYDYRYDVNSEPISFDTPSLEYLEFNDILRYDYPVVNLDSLVEAKLQLRPLYDGDYYELTNLINGLKNVQILILDYLDTMPLIDAFFQVVPVFEKLLRLSLNTESHLCWNALVLLLEKSPYLKTLTIEKLHYQYRDGMDLTHVCECLSGYSFLMSCPIETLKITDFQGSFGEMVQIKLILQNLLCLEVLEVRVRARRFGKMMQIMLDLLMLPKASSKCRVQFKFY